jgi:hypothetical protein
MNATVHRISLIRIHESTLPSFDYISRENTLSRSVCNFIDQMLVAQTIHFTSAEALLVSENYHLPG